jgi:hypothetical protein
MATIEALQHLYSSVARGYAPGRGQGFQTVAVAPELAGTEDLTALEDASFYAVSRERRARGDLPVKETFFRLPSGRFALGRSVPVGTDALGREGNYLTHHLIVSRDDLIAVNGDPFALLDAAPPAPEIDLTPRDLPPLALAVAPAALDVSALADLAPWLRAALGVALIERGDRTLLIAGDEARSRDLLRSLGAALPREERLRLTFSTHFYESEHLRAHFAVVTAGSAWEAPSRPAEYLLIRLDEEPSSSGPSPATAYGKWFAASLHAGDWAEIRTMRDALHHLRSGESRPGEPPLPAGGTAGAALWEQVGPVLARALVGQPERITEYLAGLPDGRKLAESLMAAAAPSPLCGGTPKACLQAVRGAASPRAWRAWLRQWAADPALASLARDVRPWWRRWRR